MKGSKRWFEEIWKLDDFLILDSETTGLDSSAEILQLGIVTKAGEAVFDKLIRPWSAQEWPGAQRVHGISPEMVQDCAPISHHKELYDLLHEKTVLVYNAPYDSRMFRQSLAICGCDWYPMVNWVDVMVPYARFWRGWGRRGQKWQKLTDACHQQGVAVIDAHSAVGDCRMTLALIKKLAGGE